MLSTIAVLLQEPVAAFELGVLTEVFGIDRTDDGVPAFDFRVCAVDPSMPLASNSGIRVLATHGLDAAADADVLAIPAGPMDGPFCEDVLEVVRQGHARGAQILSVCSGAFTLGAAGLLDGRSVTTHWRYADRLVARYPSADVDLDVLYVDDDRILTSAGTAAGIDACLYLVRRELGAAVANRIARRMVVPPHRDGGQRQFIESPLPECQSDSLEPVLAWVLDHLGEELSVPQLAKRAQLSERTFARRFGEVVGTTPHRWISGQRVIRARELLESTDLDVEAVAHRVGFTSAAALRPHFLREVGIAPTAYRRRFASAAS